MSRKNNILVLGATSAIAQAYARLRAGEGAGFTLVGRQEGHLKEIANDLISRGASPVEIFATDLAKEDAIEDVANNIRSRFGEPDEIFISYGVLGDASRLLTDIPAADTLLKTNFTSSVMWTLAFLKDRAPDIPLTIVALGSVAGDRGRANNPLYCASKGGLDVFLQGLQQVYDNSPVRILIVKPGPTDTPMTASLDKRNPLSSSPDKVAADILRAINQGRRSIYTPWFWWPIMFVIRHLPWFIFRRLQI